MRGHQVELWTGERRIRMGVDAAGRWVAPESTMPRYDVGSGLALGGLVDAHAHLTAAAITDMTDEPRRTGAVARITKHVADQLGAGVLLTLDKGTMDPATVEVTLGIGEADRPEVQLAGRFLAVPEGYYADLAIELDPSCLDEAIASYGPAAAQWVKLIGDWPRRGAGAVPNFDEAALRRGVEAAHRSGRRVAIHTAAPETPGMAVRAGVDSIEHGLFMTEDDVAELGARNGAWVPTILAMEALSEAMRPGSTGAALVAEGLANLRRLLPGAMEAGVVVMAGTDLALAYEDLAREGMALFEYGLSEDDAVTALTEGPRRFLGAGSFLAGNCADFVLVAYRTLAALAEPRLVVRCGNVVVDRR